VCQPEGIAHAVLLRALAPVAGIEQMRAARSRGRGRGQGQGEGQGQMDGARSRGQRRPVSDRDLCRGPGRLTQALGITGEHDGADLVTGAGGARLIDDRTPPPAEPGVSLRVGLTHGADLPLRFFVAGDRHASGPRS
jgi:DNA-3-methyladenine glycosylase